MGSWSLGKWGCWRERCLECVEFCMIAVFGFSSPVQGKYSALQGTLSCTHASRQLGRLQLRQK
eukprot:123425-Amphidinium_carterae.1